MKKVYPEFRDYSKACIKQKKIRNISKGHPTAKEFKVHTK